MTKKDIIEPNMVKNWNFMDDYLFTFTKLTYFSVNFLEKCSDNSLKIDWI